ncbi:hypothetical protein EOL72_02285 [Candidatus Falkowbacteria bacterium]|nr:hypothetical protein [Candidatus Falkowbacteria bacterium]
MFDYLQKFDGLPDEIQASVSSPQAMALISDLEKKYQVDLAALVIRIAVKEIPLADLPAHLVSELHLTPDNARLLTADFKEKLFPSIANYLGYNPSYAKIVPQTKAVSDTFFLIKKVIRESGLNFSGSELNTRLENILKTYFKGVRSRIDTRLALNKGVASGGLGLDHKIIDNLFLLIDQSRENSVTKNASTLSAPKDAKNNQQVLEKVRAVYEQPGANRDIPYDLKTAIANRQKIETVSSQKLLEDGDNQKLLEDGDKLSLEAPSLTPLVAPSSETKLVESEPVQPEEKIIPEKIETNQKKEVAPVLAPAPVKQASTVTPPVKPEPKITTPPLSSAKENLQTIEQPPKKKPNLFQKALSLFAQTKKETPLPTVAQVSASASPATASVAALRQQAQQNINNPHLRPGSTPLAKTKVITEPQKPITKPQIASVPKVAAAPQAPSSLKPKTLGPVEELHYLELLNFRRLGTSPKDAASKIEKKIRTLEADGYDRMVEAILAWRSGEINSIYVKMAKEALKYQITLKQVADKYQAQKNSQYLTWEEIQELIALNHRLSF